MTKANIYLGLNGKDSKTQLDFNSSKFDYKFINACRYITNKLEFQFQ